jgi:transglutaminase-like putative cysteine protease
MRRTASVLCAFALALAVPSAHARGRVPAPPSEPSHTYDLRWSVRVDQVPSGIHVARVWVAIPQELPEQRVSGLEVRTPYRHRLVTDPTFHNRVALVEVSNPPESFTIDLSAHVVRAPVSGPRRAVLSPRARALYLRKEALVSLSPRVHALADSIGRTNRARYDYVLATMDYDKTAPGWGNGDTERACDVHKGNCTDFHSLFMSLSRAEGVPALFEMGYPTQPGGEVAQAGGYHCWAWFYDDHAKAWSPVDISEARKHPEKSEFFFGHLDADRITFSRGRDVLLPGMRGAPLNYLPVGGYVEVDGRPLTQGVTRLLTYTVDIRGTKARS